MIVSLLYDCAPTLADGYTQKAQREWRQPITDQDWPIYVYDNSSCGTLQFQVNSSVFV